MKALPDLLRPWIEAPFVTLGTDGFGRSDTRESLRSYFEIDAPNIAAAALVALAKRRRHHRRGGREGDHRAGHRPRQGRPARYLVKLAGPNWQGRLSPQLKGT